MLQDSIRICNKKTKFTNMMKLIATNLIIGAGGTWCTRNYNNEGSVLQLETHPSLSGSTAEEEGLKVKHSRVSPDVVWEWEGDGGRWNRFSPAHSQALTDSLVRKDKECTLQVRVVCEAKGKLNHHLLCRLLMGCLSVCASPP